MPLSDMYAKAEVDMLERIAMALEEQCSEVRRLNENIEAVIKEIVAAEKEAK